MFKQIDVSIANTFHKSYYNISSITGNYLFLPEIDLIVKDDVHFTKDFLKCHYNKSLKFTFINTYFQIKYKITHIKSRLKNTFSRFINSFL